jgi:hypothetical protein
MTSYQEQPTPALTEHQQRTLASVQDQGLADALNQVLIDRGLALSIRAIAFQELAPVPASETIGPDPSTGPPTAGLPSVPGINYVCEQLSSGDWVCKCSTGEPGGGPIASFPPVVVSQ